VKIAAPLLDEVVAHALQNPRIECCGVVAVQPAGDHGERTATRVYRAENIHASALKFEIDPMELFRLSNAIEEEGWEIGAIYHSHVRSAPYPSQTDIGFAASWPGVEWLIVGLAGGEQPLVLSYLIDGPDVQAVAIEVADEPAGEHAGASEAPS
jgi:proteasome lid subunit RPN8/RPN11